MKNYICLLVVFAFVLTAFPSCNGEKICAGLNANTGTFNSPKNARKNRRGGGYRTPGELDARDRQKKRLRKKTNRSKRAAGGLKGRGGTGNKGFRGGFSFHWGGGRVSGSAQGSVRY